MPPTPPHTHSLYTHFSVSPLCFPRERALAVGNTLFLFHRQSGHLGFFTVPSIHPSWLWMSSVPQGLWLGSPPKHNISCCAIQCPGLLSTSRPLPSPRGGVHGAAHPPHFWTLSPRKPRGTLDGAGPSSSPSALGRVLRFSNFGAERVWR